MTIDDTRYRGDETNGFALRTVVAAEYDRPFWLNGGAQRRPEVHGFPHFPLAA